MLEISQKDFDSIVKITLEQIEQLLLIKGKEYVRNNDPLHNFNVTANYNKEHQAKSLHGMLSKHLTSYLDMLDDIELSDKDINLDKINEKFGDILVYFILQKVIFVVDFNNKNNLK